MHPIARGLTLRYGLVLVGIALLALGSHLLLSDITEREGSSAAEINIAGRQRMLIQRIALLGMELDRLPENQLRKDIRKAYVEAVEQLEQAHRILIGGDPALGIEPPASSALQSLYFGPRAHIDRDLAVFIQQARHLLSEHEERTPSRIQDHDHAGEFAIMAFGGILGDLETAVRQHQADSNARILRLKRLHDATLVAILVVLILAAAGVFHPMVRRIVRQFQEVGEVQETLRKLSRAVEESPASILITDAAGQIEYVNRKFCELTGYTAAEVKGRNPRILKTGHSAPEKYKDLWGSLAAGREWHGEFLNRRKDGTTFWEMASISPLKDPDGRITHFLAVKEDITQRKAMEENLRAVRAEYDSLVSSIRQGVSKVDLSGTITFANAAHDAMYGFSPGGSVGRKVWDLAHPDDAGDMIAFFRRVLTERPEPTPYVCRHVRRDGSEMVVQTDWGYEYGPGGEVVAFVTVMADITDRRRAEILLQEAKEEAERANRAKSEFLSRMSHELRTPLNAIIGFGQLLQFNPKEPLSSKQGEAVGHILQGGRHLLELINEVLDLARIEAGRLELSVEDVDACRLLGDCLPLIQPLAGARGIDLRVQTGRPAPVRADYTRLKQVLLNLMSNAVKYNRDGGSVSVVLADAPNGMLRIDVTDTGPGIPEERQADLFEPFNRLGAENTEVEGTGIGLTITKRLIEAMGGRIGLVSRPGEGTTFWVEVPAAEMAILPEETAASEAPEPAPEAAEPCPGRLLYIEDNPTNQELMRIFLVDNKGFDLTVAESAEEGLELVKRNRPDLILMDINLPGMSGVEAVRTLKADSATRDIPVVAISAAAMPKDLEAGTQAGFDAYLTKPINLKEVFATVTQLLGA